MGQLNGLHTHKAVTKGKTQKLGAEPSYHRQGEQDRRRGQLSSMATYFCRFLSVQDITDRLEDRKSQLRDHLPLGQPLFLPCYK